MKAIVTRSSRVSLSLCLLTALVLLAAPRAEAQVSPLWDHYKVYFMNPPFPYPVPGPGITLTDQFGQWTHQVLALEQFANPVEKNHGAVTYPINDPILHYSWWRISPQPMSLLVTAVNQFGDHTLSVYDAQFLWNPALKNTTGQPPLRNHYKCYDCQGPPVNVPVGMMDQFGPWTATVMFPRFFCNPVQKLVGDPGAGQVYPILDPNQHYVCYEFQPEDPNPHTAVMTDQFVPNLPMELHPSRLICVPTYKSGVTSSAKDTWGRLKVLYR
jgi:hypothetical protein